MSDLVEQLRGQGETLRESARDRRFISAPDEIADWYDSLADLIDGTLARHQPLNDGPLSLVSEPYCSCRQYKATVMSDGAMGLVPVEFPCPDLVGLARHVSSVIGEVTA